MSLERVVKTTFMAQVPIYFTSLSSPLIVGYNWRKCLRDPSTAFKPNELRHSEHVFSHKITQVFGAVSFDFQQFVSLEAHFLAEFEQILCKRSESKLVWTSSKVLWYFHHNFKYLRVEALKALQLKSLSRISWVFAKFEVAWIKNRSKTWKLCFRNFRVVFALPKCLRNLSQVNEYIDVQLSWNLRQPKDPWFDREI